MAKTIGSLGVTVSANTAAFQKGMQSSVRHLNDFRSAAAKGDTTVRSIQVTATRTSQALGLVEQGALTFGGAAAASAVSTARWGSQAVALASRFSTLAKPIGAVVGLLTGPVGLVAGVAAAATAAGYFATQWLTGANAVAEADKALKGLNARLAEQQKKMGESRLTALKEGTQHRVSEAQSALEAARTAAGIRKPAFGKKEWELVQSMGGMKSAERSGYFDARPDVKIAAQAYAQDIANRKAADGIAEQVRRGEQLQHMQDELLETAKARVEVEKEIAGAYAESRSQMQQAAVDRWKNHQEMVKSLASEMGMSSPTRFITDDFESGIAKIRNRLQSLKDSQDEVVYDPFSIHSMAFQGRAPRGVMGEQVVGPQTRRDLDAMSKKNDPDTPTYYEEQMLTLQRELVGLVQKWGLPDAGITITN